MAHCSGVFEFPILHEKRMYDYMSEALSAIFSKMSYAAPLMCLGCTSLLGWQHKSKGNNMPHNGGRKQS